MKHLIIVSALLMLGCGNDQEESGCITLEEICGTGGAIPETPSTGGSSTGGTSGTGGSSVTPTGGSVAVCDCPDPIPGPAGDPGSPGTDGSSCSVSQTASGATITCEDGTSAVVANGSDGAPGADGLSIIGPMGPAGADSTVPGPAGPQGERGLTGATGPAGADSTVPGPTGPQGERGLTGATGPTGPSGADSTVPGPQGPQGEPGLGFDTATLYKVEVEGSPTEAGIFMQEVTCNAGDMVLHGGCWVFHPGVDTNRLQSTRPLFDVTVGYTIGWHCQASMSSAAVLIAYAICVAMP